MASFDLRKESRWLLLVSALAIATFLLSLGGDFVYDDRRQILMNTAIQDPSLYVKALTSDVWAFKGDGSIPASNYYRPTFVAWMIANYAFWGALPMGWHLTNIVLHAFVCILGFVFLRRIGMAEYGALAVAAIFAVHPVHVESVTWIAGSADLLFSASLLGSLIAALAFARTGRRSQYVVSIVLYLIALGSKEVAMICSALFFLAFLSDHDTVEPSIAETPVSTKRAMLLAGPFVAAAAVFFLIRLSVIGRLQNDVESAPTFESMLLSIPAVFLFYLRQIFVPFELAVNYPIRPVEAINAANFILPFAVLITFGALAVRLSRSQRLIRFGALMFLLPLVPAFVITAFPREQIVHDRYLYLPLLGVLLMVMSFAASQLRSNSRRMAATFVVVVVVGLGIRSIVYQQVWLRGVSLWAHSVSVDPSSAFNWLQLGVEYSLQGRHDDAVKALDHSISISPTLGARVARLQSLIQARRSEEAIASIDDVFQSVDSDANAYTIFQGIEAAAMAYSETGRWSEAESVLRRGRTMLPIYQAALTDKLAVVLYNQDRKQDALGELESARGRAQTDLLPASRSVLFRLGILEAELGRTAQARLDLKSFIESTDDISDPIIVAQRKQAAKALERLP